MVRSTSSVSLDDIADQDVLFRTTGVDRSEFDRVTAGERLAAGPIFLKRGPFRRAKVPPGTVVIVTQDLKPVDTLREGGHFTLSLSPLFRLEQYVVDVRPRALTVRKDGLSIAFRGPRGLETLVTVSVELSITYQVVDPERLLRDVTRKPLAELYKRAVEVTRNIVDATDYETFVRRGPTGSLIRDHLTALDLPKSLGIAVTGVTVVDIGDNDVIKGIRSRELAELVEIEREETRAAARREQEELDSAARRERERLDAVNRAGIAEETGQDAELLAFIDHPQLLADILAGRRGLVDKQAEILIAMFDNGTLASLGLPPAQSSALISQAFLMQPSARGRVQETPQTLPNASTPSLSAAQPGPPASGPHATQYVGRLAEEVEELRALWNVTCLPTDEQGWSTVLVRADSPEGKPVALYIDCPLEFPDKAPTLHATVDRQPVASRPLMLARWDSTDRLVTLARAALTDVDEVLRTTATPPSNVVSIDSRTAP